MSSHNQTTQNSPTPTPPSSIRIIHCGEDKCTVNEAIANAMCGFFILCIFMLMVIGVCLYMDGKITPEFHVFSLSTSHLKINQQHLDRLFSANWTLGFSVKNPGKQSTISYDTIEVAISYHSVSLSSTSLCPFYQDENDQRLMNTNMGAYGLLVDRAVARDIVLGWKMGAVNFTITMDGKLRVDNSRTGSWKNLTVRCEDLTVGILSNITKEGSLIGGPKKCSVRVK